MSSLPKVRTGADTYRPTFINGKKKRSPEYNSWQSMKKRCLYPKDKQFKDYGGRGITVCERWLSFDNFIEDMGPQPKPGLTIERRDNNGNYNKDNCYWATRLEQAQNRKTTHPLPVDTIKRVIRLNCA